MRIGIFDPYLDSLGGGERYTMILAKYLNQQGHGVDVFWNDERIKKEIKERLGINLGKIRFVEDIFSSNKNLLQKWQVTRKYDLIFYLSDGSIPFLFGKKNFLYFLVPFTNVNGRSLLNKIKLKRIHQIIAISKFTKRFIDKEYSCKSKIIYPPAPVEEFKSLKKENLILSVGRFTKALHDKRQDVLIDVFKKMCDRGLKSWQLVLIGGAEEENKLVERLKRKAGNYPIKILINVSFDELKLHYGQAKIFWLATGFGSDEERHPEGMEHFGIVAVEAMAAGCVPVVIDKGGLPEIINHKKNGVLWKMKKELKELTLQLIKAQGLWQKLSSQAIKDSQKFSKKVFCRKIDELIKN